MRFIYIFSLLKWSEATVFTSTFSSAATNGATGSFDVTIVNGVGAYEWSLDLNELFISTEIVAAGCTKKFIGTYGLKYHIHQSWNNTNLSSNSCASCKGHYDPFLACGDKSQSYSTLCVEASRTAAQGYKYRCNSSEYTNGFLSQCEVGDLSGKFGVMHSLSTSNLTFGGVISGDPNPPIVANYGKSDLISNVWSSVVLHCPIVNLSAGYTNPAILCAKLVPTNLPSTVNTPAIVSNQQNLSLNLEGEFAAFLTVPGTNGSFIVKIDGTGQPYLQYHNFSPSHFEDLTFLGVGSYYWNFNLTGLKTLSSTDVTNIIENGIKYHIHDSWKDSNISSTSCSIAGKHYDPYLACSDKSQSYSTICDQVKRNLTYGYKYSCNRTIYETNGHISQCEVGDLSGKNGLMHVVDRNEGLYFSGSFENDPNGPITSNYFGSNAIWKSIVFHKPIPPYDAFYCSLLIPQYISYPNVTVIPTILSSPRPTYTIAPGEIFALTFTALLVSSYVSFMIYSYFMKKSGRMEDVTRVGRPISMRGYGHGKITHTTAGATVNESGKGLLHGGSLTEVYRPFN